MIWVVTLPITGRPSESLININQRIHWCVRSRRTRHWRSLAHVTALSAVNRRELPRLPWAQVDAWFALPGGGRRDVANLYPTVKAAIDGIVDAGVLPDDDDTHLSGPYLHRLLGDKGPARIELVISDEPVVAQAPGVSA